MGWHGSLKQQQETLVEGRRIEIEGRGRERRRRNVVRLFVRVSVIHSNDSPLVLRRQRRRARGARDLQRQGFATSPNVTKSCTLSHLQLQSSRPKKGLFAASLRTCFRDVIRDSGKDGEEKEGEAGRILSSFSESARAHCAE